MLRARNSAKKASESEPVCRAVAYLPLGQTEQDELLRADMEPSLHGKQFTVPAALNVPALHKSQPDEMLSTGKATSTNHHESSEKRFRLGSSSMMRDQKWELVGQNCCKAGTNQFLS